MAYNSLTLNQAGTNELVPRKVDLLGWMNWGGMIGDVLLQLNKNILGWLPLMWGKKAGSCSTSGADVVDIHRGQGVGWKGLAEGGTNELRGAVGLGSLMTKDLPVEW